MKSTFIFSAFFLFFTLNLGAQNQETRPVALEKISGSLYLLTGGSGANGGVFIGETGVLVIDSKMNEESVNQSIEAIKKISDKPIKYLVNTHSDGDHINGNRWFPETVTFVAHINCRDDFFKENSGRASDWDKPEFFPFTPSVTFCERLDLWLGHDKVELYYFGIGHTTGDCVVYFPEDKVAFIGDQYFAGRPQLIHSHKNGNSFEHVKTLTKMLETIDAEKFCSGHSDIVGREDIKKHIQSMVERQDKVRKLIGQDKTIDEVLAQFDQNEARLVNSIYTEIKGF